MCDAGQAAAGGHPAADDGHPAATTGARTARARSLVPHHENEQPPIHGYKRKTT